MFHCCNNHYVSIQDAKLEVQLMSKIPPHPNIIQLLDHAIVNQHLWIFTEFCTRGSLDDFCTKERLSTEDRFRFMTEISEALRHLHKLRPPIAHRDIKPDNVLMTPSGQRIVTKLTDFGVSKIASTIQQMKTCVGTMAFMAPEVFRAWNNEAIYTVKVDIFSLALLMLSLVDADQKPLQVMLSKYISYKDKDKELLFSE